jgi:hypothetical protein
VRYVTLEQSTGGSFFWSEGGDTIYEMTTDEIAYALKELLISDEDFTIAYVSPTSYMRSSRS